MDQGAGRPAPVLARIYAFSFEGHSWDLYKPAIFVVHGDGQPAEPIRPPNRAGRAPGSADETGVAAQSYSYSEDMMMWPYDKDDISIRLDVETGPFEQILLESVMKVEAQRTAGANGFPTVSVAVPNVSGELRVLLEEIEQWQAVTREGDKIATSTYEAVPATTRAAIADLRGTRPVWIATTPMPQH